MQMRNTYELWLNQVAESERTRISYRQNMRCFAEWLRENYELDAREIPSKWRAAKYESLAARERYLDQLKDILRDYFADLRGPYAPGTINLSMSIIISYLHAFDIPVKRIRLKHAFVTYHNRDIKKDEVREILQHSDVRNRAAYMVLYESGMRPDTLRKLRWRHIEEEFLSHRVPMKIELPQDILKCHVSERWAFIGEDGVNALKTYLTTRLPLEGNDYLFEKEKTQGRQLGVAALSQAFNRTVKKLGLAEPVGPEGKKPKEIRLYCLRKAFRKFMLTEEAYKEFWMGHTSTAIHYVSRDPEYHRKLYAEGYENLRLEKPGADVAVISKLAGENLALKDDIKMLLGRLETVEGRYREIASKSDVLLDVHRENIKVLKAYRESRERDKKFFNKLVQKVEQLEQTFDKIVNKKGSHKA